MKMFLLNVLIAYVGLLIFAYFFADKMIFLPPRASYRDTDEIIKLTSNGAQISAIYLPNENAKYTLLVSHGNAEDLGYIMPFFKEFQRHGFSVFAYDYHGYGTSEGSPNEANSYADVRAAYDYLVNVLRISPQRIIIYGRSLGAAVALDLAIKENVAGLIMESPFVTAFRAVTRIPIFPFDEFNNLQKITKLTCPLLIIHGTDDRIVSFWHGKKLLQMANVPKQYFWVTNAGHNDVLPTAGNEYWQALDGFVKMLDERNLLRWAKM